MNLGKENPDVVTRAIALLLGLGGVAGVGIGIWTDVKILTKSGIRFSPVLALFGVFILVFGWSTWVGVDLWRNRAPAYKWAKVLLALQIPNIGVPGFAYQFYTAMSLYLSWNGNEGRLGLDFEVASSISVQVSGSVEGLILGVNLIALAALIYMLSISRQARSSPTT